MSVNPTSDDPARLQESFRICRDEVKHEFEVLATRLNSYITSQSFLVSAYAVSMNNANPNWGAAYRFIFPLVLSGAGFLLSLQAYPGIYGAARKIERWHQRQYDLLERGAGLDDYQMTYWKGIDQIDRQSLWFARAAPWIFGLTWIVLATLAAWLTTRA